VHNFIKKLKSDTGVDVTKVVLLGNEAEVHSASHPILKIKLDEELEKTLSYVQITLDSKEYKNFMEAQNDETIQISGKYIDLRFGNRVYYK